MSARISQSCPSAALLWAATRILCDVHWVWDAEQRCYKTHQWTRDARPVDVRVWPAPTALSSLRQAIHGDDRLVGEPMLRFILLEIALEYVAAIAKDRRL